MTPRNHRRMAAETKEAHQCFTVSETSYLQSLGKEDRKAPCFAVHYQKPPVDHGDGTRSISLCAPVLIVSAWMADQQAIAEKVAAILNEHWEDAA